MPGKPELFDDDSNDSDAGELSINKDYAQRYEGWRAAEIKEHLKNKYGSGDELSSSESSAEEENPDPDPEELKKVLSKDFFEVISSLKKKDPRIYDPNVEFFKSEKGSHGDDHVKKGTVDKKGEENKPMFLRDYERKIILEKGGRLSDDESDDENQKQKARSASPSYMKEQEQIKESFQKVLMDSDSDSESHTFLQKKEKTKEEKEKEEEEHLAWLKGEKEDITDPEIKEKLKPLKNAWSDPKLDETEKFLRDYVLNKRYLEKDASGDAEDLTDDDLMDEYMNDFERSYNFRFEEPDQEFEKRYPRNIEHSLRQKNTRRKDAHKAAKERKKAEKERKREELKLLKSLKRKEILEKIEKIKQITGNDDLGLQPEELEDDFDPEAHDRRMRELFSDGYYEGAEDVENVEELNIPPLEEELSDHENWDEWDGTDREQEEAVRELESTEPSCEDPNFNMDCDYDPTLDAVRKQEKTLGRKSAKEKRKLKRQSRFGRLVRKEKPVFDPNDKSFQQYIDEYYGMDYEDLIGDMPCRFKYTNVVPNSFGLTIEEILAADDKELNRWANISKTYTIRPEHVERNEARIYEMKARDEALKHKMLPSIFQQEEESHPDCGEKPEKKRKVAQVEVDSFKSGHHDEGDVKNTKSKKKKIKKGKSDERHSLNSSFNVTPMPNIEDSFNKEEKRRHKNQEASTLEPTDDRNTSSVSVGAKKKKKKKTKTENKNDEHNQSFNAENQVDANCEKTKRSDKIIGAAETSLKRAHPDDGMNQKFRKKQFKGNSEPSERSYKDKQHLKKKKADSSGIEYSDARLKAYGFHPKKFKNKLKYGNHKTNS